MKVVYAGLFGIICALAVLFQQVSADSYSSSSYKINGVVGGSFSGSTTSTTYKLESSGGEPIIGQGASGSYKLDSGYIAQLQRSLKLTVQPAGLKAYYPFEENTGTLTFDQSSYAGQGTLQSGTTWTGGKVGNGVNPNSTADVQIADSPQLTFGQHMTLSIWANQAGAAVSKALASHWGGASVGTEWALQTPNGSSDRLWFFVASSLSDAGGNTIETPAGSWTTGAWHHVVVTYDGTIATAADRAKIYIDGVLQTTIMIGTIPSTFTDSSYPVTIGSLPGYGRYFNGSLDEFKLFDRTLSTDEVKAEYAAGLAGTTAGLSFTGGITPGVSQTSAYDAVVVTDSSAYTLALSQNQDLTKGSDTISSVAGSIASPVTWSEGTTKGLGFTLYGTNATALDSKWSSGGAYAALPGSATSVYTRTGTQSARDVISMRLRLDVPTTQPSGLYSNVMTVTGTITP